MIGESGVWKSRGFIQGGRQTEYTGWLYMSAMVAVRYTDDFKRETQRTRSQGGNRIKVALAAVMRKLLVATFRRSR